MTASGDAKPFIDAAQRLIFLKGTDSHDYKFSSAVLEDYLPSVPELRDRFLAASYVLAERLRFARTALVARTGRHFQPASSLARRHPER